jgi:serpin B
MTRLVLTNAIYFKGTWLTQFDEKKTRKAPFYVTPTAPVSADMMSLEAEFRFGGDDATQVVELPYKGKDLAMLVLLPVARDGLPALEARLDNALLDSWLAGMATREQIVELPKFEMTKSFSLNGTLADMGMPSVFDPSAADLSGIDGARDLFVQTAVHKAFVKVNEEGTEAAAATGISVGVTSMPSSFTADHPFLFLIRDNVTGSILFLGRVTDPTVTG